MYDIVTVNNILAKLESKLKRQQTNSAETAMELEHWRKIRSEIEKAGKK